MPSGQPFLDALTLLAESGFVDPPTSLSNIASCTRWCPRLCIAIGLRRLLFRAAHVGRGGDSRAELRVLFILNLGGASLVDARVPASGKSLLAWAAERGYASVVALLIKLGASTSGEDAFGRTALHLCAKQGQARCVRLLLEAGADARARDHLGQTPLVSGRVSSCHCMRDGAAVTKICQHLFPPTLNTAQGLRQRPRRHGPHAP